MNQKSVSDLGAAAFLLMRGFKVVGRKGKDIFFSLTQPTDQQRFDRLTMDYLASEFHRFDSCIMSLKKMGNFSCDPNSRYVTDLGVAAYLLMNKYTLLGRNGKAIYFEVDLPELDEVALRYLSSEFHQFDSCLMSLKRIGEYITDQNR